MAEVMNGIGQRLRDFRKKRGLTLQELGTRAHLSPSYLSQIENAHANLTLDTLLTLATELDVHIADLFVDRDASQVSVVRAGQIRSYDLKDGGRERLLFGNVRTSLQVAIIELPPFGTYAQFDSHPGEEFTFVLSGKAQVQMGDGKSYDLEAGEMVYYRSTLPHRWVNITADPMSVMVVNTPASF